LGACGFFDFQKGSLRCERGGEGEEMKEAVCGLSWFVAGLSEEGEGFNSKKQGKQKK